MMQLEIGANLAWAIVWVGTAAVLGWTVVRLFTAHVVRDGFR